MRASAALLITASFSAICRSARFPSRMVSAFEHHAFADAMFPGEHLLEQRVELLARDAGQESQPAQIDREDRNLVAFQRARRRKQSAVAAQNDQQIDLFGECFARQSRHARVDAGLRFLVDENVDLPLAQPRDQRRDHGRDDIFERFADDAGGRESWCWTQHSILPAVGAREEKTPGFLPRRASGSA